MVLRAAFRGYMAPSIMRDVGVCVFLAVILYARCTRMFWCPSYMGSQQSLGSLACLRLYVHGVSVAQGSASESRGF